MLEVALIRTTKEGKINCIKYRRNSNGYIKVKSDIIKSIKYCMSEITPMRQPFILTDEQYSNFREALKTQEGKKVLNELKNNKTNYIIDTYLLKERDNTIKRLKANTELTENRRNQYIKNIEDFTEKMIEEKIEGENPFGQVRLGLSREEIYHEFVRKHLIP